MLFVAVSALAQPIEEQEDQAGEKRRWRASVGGGLGVGPKYPGADTYRARILPILAFGYGNFFVGGDPGGGGVGAGGAGGGIGYLLVRDPAWRLGVTLSPGFGRARRESDHPSLEGMGDIDRTTRLGVFTGYTWRRWLSTSLRVSTDVEGNDQGTLVSLDVNARYRATERLTFSAGPGVTWADRDYTMTFFGVTPEQSARSTLPAYEAGSGLNTVRFGVGGGCRFDRHWSMGARVTAWRIVGDAADSPITRERNPYSAALFFSYRF